MRAKLNANDVLVVMHRLILALGKHDYVHGGSHCLTGDFSRKNLPRRGREFIANNLQAVATSWCETSSKLTRLSLSGHHFVIHCW